MRENDNMTIVTVRIVAAIPWDHMYTDINTTKITLQDRETDIDTPAFQGISIHTAFLYYRFSILDKITD